MKKTGIVISFSAIALLCISLVIYKKGEESSRKLFEEMSAGDCRPSAEKLYALAKDGDLEAQVEFGKAIQKNLCEIVDLWDPGLPREWFRKAAELGNAEAQAELANELVSTWRIADEEAAAYWYLKAAEQGNAKAQFGIGQIYQRGRSSKYPKNIEKALFYYHQAADGGYQPAYMLLATIYELGEEVARDDVLATQWYLKLAETGDASGQYNFAQRLSAGLGIDKDESQAFSWFNKAAVQGNKYAMYEIAQMLEQGRGVTRNEKEAVKFYHESAESGFSKAQVVLGKMYAQGRWGVPKDEEKAKYWLIKALEQYDPEAEAELEKLSPSP